MLSPMERKNKAKEESFLYDARKEHSHSRYLFRLMDRT